MFPYQTSFGHFRNSNCPGYQYLDSRQNCLPAWSLEETIATRSFWRDTLQALQMEFLLFSLFFPSPQQKKKNPRDGDLKGYEREKKTQDTSMWVTFVWADALESQATVALTYLLPSVELNSNMESATCSSLRF